MNTQPPRRSDRTTWISPEGTTWRIELITGRWSLSRYSPTTQQWTRTGSYPTRDAAWTAAYEKDRP